MIEYAVPAIFGRPPRTFGSRSIKVPISVTDPILITAQLRPVWEFAAGCIIDRMPIAPHRDFSEGDPRRIGICASF
ncbi:MAG: hypothetical protein ABSH09_31140 [Bryobacteraceae bacterium]